MSQLIEPVARLIESFSRLPGIGPKTAQRLTYHLLRAPDTEARALAAALVSVRDDVVFCERCFDISTGPLCPICADPGRDDARLCVVEEPLDVLALERTRAFKGRYHVLHGAISPVDGVGPDRLHIRELLERVADRSASGEAPVPVPGVVRLVIELDVLLGASILTAAVWRTGVGAALGAAVVLHYALTPRRVRWLLGRRA